jgi:hypothetical protein
MLKLLSAAPEVQLQKECWRFFSSHEQIKPKDCHPNHEDYIEESSSASHSGIPASNQKKCIMSRSFAIFPYEK